MPVGTLPIDLVAAVIGYEARPEPLALLRRGLSRVYLPYFRALIGLAATVARAAQCTSHS